MISGLYSKERDWKSDGEAQFLKFGFVKFNNERGEGRQRTLHVSDMPYMKRQIDNEIIFEEDIATVTIFKQVESIHHRAVEACAKHFRLDCCDLRTDTSTNKTFRRFLVEASISMAIFISNAEPPAL